MPTTTPDLLTVRQAAHELGLSPRSVLHRITTGTLAATKIGDGRTSAYIVTRAEVERVREESGVVVGVDLSFVTVPGGPHERLHRPGRQRRPERPEPSA